MSPTSARNDPYRNSNFLVEIDNVTVAGFSECTGLTSEVEVIEYRNGSEDQVLRKLPGLIRFGPVTLKRGLTASRELYQWHQKVLQGKTERQSLSIVLLDDARQPVARWNVREAWPQKYEGPRLNARSSEVAIETLVICCEGITLE
jgi:phage tail-like protein